MAMPLAEGYPDPTHILARGGIWLERKTLKDAIVYVQAFDLRQGVWTEATYHLPNLQKLRVALRLIARTNRDLPAELRLTKSPEQIIWRLAHKDPEPSRWTKPAPTYWRLEPKHAMPTLKRALTALAKEDN